MTIDLIVGRELLRREIMDAVQSGRTAEILPLTGQTAGLVREVLPAADVVRRIVADAERALAGGAAPTA